MKRLLFLLALYPLAAQAAPDPCARAPRLAEPWTSWPQSGAAIAGGTIATAPRLILGKPVTATLRPTPQVQFPVPPGKSISKSYAGLFTLAVSKPARIGIALSDAAWIDISTGTTFLPAVDHGHGAACSGIRKIVWFDLPPGLHGIQIAASPKPVLRIMAADARANQPEPRQPPPD